MRHSFVEYGVRFLEPRWCLELYRASRGQEFFSPFVGSVEDDF